MLLVTVPLSVAPTLSWRQHDLHPTCVTPMPEVKEGDTRDLRTCSSTKGAVGRRDGFVTWVSAEDERVDAAYRVVGRLGPEWLVEWRWSGGGTGRFSGLQLVRLEGDTLRVGRSLASGDRCNGGLVSAALTKGHVHYSVVVTPLDVLAATAEGRALGLSEKALESSALSCAATLEFEGDALLAMVLSEPLEDRAGWTERFGAQACFNRVHRRFVEEKRARLEGATLEDFARAFRSTCSGADAGRP